MLLTALALSFFHRRSRSDAAMNQQLKAYLDEQAQAVDDDVRQALDLCDGDAVQALRITLIANAFPEENEQLKKQISKGYTRKK
jgi:hypothetical protein